MKKAFLFLALCLLGAGRAAAAEPVDSVRNVIYMIGDGMGLAHVSMLAVEGGYAPTAFDRAQGIALDLFGQQPGDGFRGCGDGAGMWEQDE